MRWIKITMVEAEIVLSWKIWFELCNPWVIFVRSGFLWIFGNHAHGYSEGEQSRLGLHYFCSSRTSSRRREFRICIND